MAKILNLISICLYSYLSPQLTKLIDDLENVTCEEVKYNKVPEPVDSGAESTIRIFINFNTIFIVTLFLFLI
ncbi:hypothetical protein PIROE2DRAFT_6938 [Piromyces sp. E2]|nr:hypothetical protein PIROE2DRAFT_6938 [Piromyces sp. E2]|eukprot:OUM65954.1 hypothetical protein PIROE2DRAFT_6938 [Piromyces sp. E2]